MLVNTELFIAYKCSQCDHVQIFSIYVFLLLNKENSILRCKCDGSYIRLIKINEDKFKLAVYCQKCEDTHMFLLSRKVLLNEEALTLYCPYSKLELFIIGNNKYKVLEKIDEIEMVKESYISKKINFKDHFVNSKVMAESLGKINSIRKSGKLVCGCGSDDISVFLLKDKLLLRCKNCRARKEIKAKTNKDLMCLLNSDHIFL